MGDERDVAEAGVDRRGGVLDVDDKGGAADGCAVGVRGLDAEVLGELEGGRPARGTGGEDAVDLGEGDAGVLEGVAGGLGVKLEGGLVGDDADLVGLVGADDGDGLEESGFLAVGGGHGVHSRDCTVRRAPDLQAPHPPLSLSG